MPADNDTRLLYKYRSLAGDGLAHIRTTLVRRMLWLSKPDAFNDPFDCVPAIKTSWERSDILKTARRVADRRARNLPRWQRRRERRKFENISDFNKFVTPEEAQAEAQRFLADMRTKLGVLSLSEDPTNILMWSHYALNHTGLVLAFRTDKDDLISEARPVIYDEARPMVDLVGDRVNTMEKMLLRKADFWRYEREWRVIRVNASGLQSFDPGTLHGIIFGQFTPIEEIESIQHSARVGGHRLRYSRAHLDQETYRLQLRDL